MEYLLRLEMEVYDHLIATERDLGDCLAYEEADKQRCEIAKLLAECEMSIAATGNQGEAAVEERGVEKTSENENPTSPLASQPQKEENTRK